MKKAIILLLVLVLASPVFAEKIIQKVRPAATQKVAFDEELGIGNYTSFQEGGGLTYEVTDAYMAISDVGTNGVIDTRDRSKIVIVIKNTDGANSITAKLVGYAKYGGSNSFDIEDSSEDSEWDIAAGDSLRIATTVAWAAVKPMVKNTVGGSAGEVRVEYGVKAGD